MTRSHAVSRPQVAGGPPFVPTSLPNLQLWLDASTLGLANGAQVASWTDLSGGNRHATPYDAASRPIYRTNVQNGLSVVSFEDIAARHNLSWPAPIMLGSAAGTIIWIEKSDNDPGTLGANALISRWGQAAVSDHVPYTDSTIYQGWGSTLRKTVGIPAARLNTFRVHTIVSGPGDWRYYLGGGAPIFTDAGNVVGWNAAAPPAAASLVHYTDAAWMGDAAEIVCYTRVLTLSEINQVGSYLAAKWGVTWNNV